MAGRTMPPSYAAAVASGNIYPAWVIRLDIDTDPLYVWTGIGELSFAGGANDPALDGLVFEGIGNLGEISSVSDAAGGGNALKLAMPGVDPNDDALKQIVTDHRKWQFQKAYLWLALLSESGALLAEPVRVKTGRMDQMEIEDNAGAGEATVAVTVEGHMAYAGEALNTRYSEQRELDPTDSSQDWVHDLANKVAELKEAPKGVSTTPTIRTNQGWTTLMYDVAMAAKANGAMR